MSDTTRYFSKQTDIAIQHFANLLSIARKDKKITMKELSDKLQVSRTTAGKIMAGNTMVGIGLYFEAARILGVPIFDKDPSRLEMIKERSERIEYLLPKKVRSKKEEIDNDF